LAAALSSVDAPAAESGLGAVLVAMSGWKKVGL